MNWNRFSLFKLPNSHKRFGYVPRYYDPRKEELQQKLDRAKNENTVDSEGNFSREIKFRAQLQDKWGNSNFKTQSMRSNIRLIVILGIIIILFYYVFVGLDGMGYFIDNNIDKLK